MNLEGSCHCGAVSFQVETEYIYPLMWCYCGRCRKTNGSPVSPHVKARRDTLSVTRGADAIRVYRVATNERAFCGTCGSSLYLLDSRWGEWVFPNAAAIDTPLPSPPQVAHIFVGSKAPWFPIHAPGPRFDEYPEAGIEDFHREWGLLDRE